MDEKDFYQKYAFTLGQLVTVLNPTSEDFSFKVTIDVGVDFATGQTKSATNEYTVPAGGHRRFPGPVANMYLDQMFKKLIQEEEQDFINANPDVANTPQSGVHVAGMADFGIRAQYYDQLIVGDPFDTLDTFQEFNGVAEHADKQPVEEAVEKPFETLEDTTNERNTSPAKPSSEVDQSTSNRAKAVASAKK